MSRFNRKLVYRVQNIADAFIAMAKQSLIAKDYVDKFPRDIATLLLFTLELPVQYKIDLTLHGAERHLCALQEIPYQDSNEPDRDLMGLLCLGYPTNVVFIKSNLPKQVQNYVLAHELAHFLVDVFFARSLWTSTLPERQSEIFKAFSWNDYDAWLDFEAYLKGLPKRSRSLVVRGKHQVQETMQKELEADLVARELLLPWTKSLAIYKKLPERNKFVTYTSRHYGIPLRIADFYYHDIADSTIPPSNLFTNLFLLNGNADQEQDY